MFKGLAALGALAITAFMPTHAALAQDFPMREPVKIVVPVPAGGLTDAIARIAAEHLQKRLGQAVVVENRQGAGSTIGTDYVAKAAADGYTILFAGAEQAVAPAVRPDLPYKYEDMTFLLRPYTIQPLVLASPAFAPSTMPEILDYMKANPERLRYGTTGVGAIVHMGSAMLEGSAGVKGVHVPYNGIAPVYTDLLAGNIDVTFGGTVPFLDGLKVVASVGSKRHPGYPDLPTLEESGIPGASWDVWFGFLAPPELPEPIAARLTAELEAVFKDPAAIEQFVAATKSQPDAEPLKGADFKAQALAEVEAWRAIAERENIVVQQ
jgi:tripartite-type tricarboxylate transporter receptor subunit TctC